MDEEDRFHLRDVLVSYFGDTSVSDGVRQMLSVTQQDLRYHDRYRGALESGLRAARAGDDDALSVARDLAPLLPNLAAAEELIREIAELYDQHYAAGTTPPSDD